ncbi:hypothetical protein [Falsiroseomonas sp. HW251]|uniref:hypothetical protein n=1 Tax=Falsiroseomonas sp. HW251 TaxID=3390998 RepID=UPI003D31E53C
MFNISQYAALRTNPNFRLASRAAAFVFAGLLALSAVACAPVTVAGSGAVPGAGSYNTESGNG